MAKQKQRVACDQCEAAMINGVFCHETGCPNQHKRYIDGEWVLFVECHECGCEVQAGESCNCQDPIEDTEVR